MINQAKMGNEERRKKRCTTQTKKAATVGTTTTRSFQNERRPYGTLPRLSG